MFRVLAVLFSAVVSATAFAQQPVPQFTVLPFAGAPRNIGDNQQAINALLTSPYGVAADPTGNFYIADFIDGLLRRVSASGIITTLADQLHGPWSVAVSPSGDLYVADTYGARILRILSSGTVTVFAGTGVPGNAGVPGRAGNAQLFQPHSVAVDASGNVFILDSGNYRVLKVTPDGAISRYAGIGFPAFTGDGNPAIQAAINYAYGIAVDSKGNLFIADSLNQVVRAVTTDGTIQTIAGIPGRSGCNGDLFPTSTAFSFPSGMAVDAAGSLYIADTQNQLVREITQPLTPNAKITTIAGTCVAGYSGDGGQARSAQLNFPRDVAIDGQGNVLIADSGNSRVRIVNPQGVIATIAGSDPAFGDSGQATAARLFSPSGIVLDNAGNTYISDTDNNRIRRVGIDGTISTFASGLNAPNGLALDSAGALYVAETNAHVIRKIANGVITVVAGTPGQSGNKGDEGMATDALLETPDAVAFDRAGVMYIADSGNNRIRTVGRDGRIHNFAGDAQQGLPGSDGDGASAIAAHLHYPRALAIDINGNVYIADFFNDRVRMVSAVTGNISTVAGTGVRGGVGAGGLATQAQLALPSGLAFDGLGNLYIADSLNNRLCVLAGGGILRSVAGGAGPGDSGDGGPSNEALLSYPRDVAVDSKGIVYFSDQDNNRVRQLVPGLVTISAVVNAASNATGAVAPGETVTIYGSLLAPDGFSSFVPATGVSLSVSAGGTQVFFDGIPAPLTYLSSGQLNAVVPYEVAGRGSTNVVVQAQGKRSDPFAVGVVDTAPGIFTSSFGAVLNQDGSRNTPANPAHAGDIVIFFATGEGQTNPPGITGKLAIGTLPAPVLPVTVQFAGQTVTLVYSGALPQGAGVLQINAVVPGGLSGDSLPVTLSVGSTQAQSGITISVQ
jgi:uncharacterized protein (TIGR03437 family)